MPVLLNPTGVLNGTAQRSLLFSLASTNRVSGTYTGRITVNWTAAGVSNPGPRKVDLVLRSGRCPGLRVRNSSPTLLGQSTVFTASLTGAGVTYQWNFGDGHSGSGATVSHLYSAVGVYTAVVTATAGITAISATMPITIVDVPITGLYAASSGFTLLGQTSAFTAGLSGGTNVAYHWTFGDGETGSGQTLTHTYALQGHYVAQVTATNSAGTATAWTALLVLDHPLDQHAYLPSIFR